MQNFLTCAASVSEAHATLISTFLVLLLGFLGYANNKNRQKREYTLTLFMPLLNEEKLTEAYNAISDWIIQKKILSHSTLDKRELDLLLRLLGYYEFLSAAILKMTLIGRPFCGNVPNHRSKLCSPFVWGLT